MFRCFSTCLFAFVLLNIAAPGLSAAEPNIIFIFVDDMGYGDLGCFRELGPFQNPRGEQSVARDNWPQTPHIDRLAAEGIRLTQFYVGSPVCSASRVTVTTGQFPSRHLIYSYLDSREKNHSKQMRDWLDPAAPCIARYFQSVGYATGHFGKWHQGGGRDVGDAPLPSAYGFDESLVSFEGLGDRILPPGRLSNRSAKLKRGKITRVEKHEQTGIYVDRSIDFIERHQREPFYLHLWLNDVHDAHVPAPGDAEKFASLTENPYEQKFFAVLTEMDRQIGRLIERIDDLGLAEQTLIVLTSDNGPTAWPRYLQEGVSPPGSTFGFRGRKWSLYEGGIRMPFIARWPGHVPAGVVDRETVMCTVDVLPTFTAVAGIDSSNANSDGENLLPALLGTLQERSKPLYWDYGRDASYLRPAEKSDQSPNLAIRQGGWKLLINDDGSQRELYRIGPHGEIDEYDDVSSEHPQIAEKLAKELLTWRRTLPVLESQE